jgi:23S rRNA pseudouridine1911/1915/1917 synthase
MFYEFIVSPEAAGKRLDVFLSDNIIGLSRTKLARVIAEGRVTVNDSTKKPGFRLAGGVSVKAEIPEEQPHGLLPFEKQIPVIYEDDSLLIINKPAGISTHPPYPGINDTLVNALVWMGKELAPINPLRPGIVHRLDKETSGVMVVAKTNQAYLDLVGQFRKRQVSKQYRAMLWGQVKEDELTVDMPLARDEKNRLRMKVSFLGAKNAKTTLKVITRYKDSTYVALDIHTGRTHQIRVHMRFLGFPIIGDKKYGQKDEYSDMFLHAYYLGLRHPQSGRQMSFEAPIPECFEIFLSHAS